MKAREKKVMESAGFYTSSMLGIDYRQAEFSYRSIKPYFKGRIALEVGTASGYMTKDLINDFDLLHLVEGSPELANVIPAYPNVIKHCSMLEDFETEQKFDTIIMSHVLEHIEYPVNVLTKFKKWLTPGGILIVVVPNAQSIHRIVAVKMGILKTAYELNVRDQALGHYRVYDTESLNRDISAAGFTVGSSGGSFLKPLSNTQIEKSWSTEMIEGFYEAGKEFPMNCAEIFIVASYE